MSKLFLFKFEFLIIDSIKNLLGKIYNNLYNNKIIKKNDIDILNIWFNYF